MDDGYKTKAWRGFLFGLACLNVSLYIHFVRRDELSCLATSNADRLTTGVLGNVSYQMAMQILAFPYVFQTSWRCIFISEYPNRRTITDHPLNSVLVARLLAALGEFCFGVQLALGLYVACAPAFALHPEVLMGLAACLVSFDGIGQCCATYGTIVGSNLPFFVEGIMWVGIFAVSMFLAATNIVLLPFDVTSTTTFFSWLVVILTMPGLLYMTMGYCPLCWEAWRQEVFRGQSTKPLLQGDAKSIPFFAKAWEALTYRAPTQAWDVWSHEFTWQTLYFTVGTWSSIGFVALPLQ
jgi:hypothetical protein